MDLMPAYHPTGLYTTGTDTIYPELVLSAFAVFRLDPAARFDFNRALHVNRQKPTTLAPPFGETTCPVMNAASSEAR